MCVQDCNPTHLEGCFNTIMKMSWSPVTSTRMIPKPEPTMCSTILCVSHSAFLGRCHSLDVFVCFSAPDSNQLQLLEAPSLRYYWHTSGLFWERMANRHPSLSVPGCVNIIIKALVSCQVISSRELIRPKDRRQVRRGWSAPHEWSENIWRSLPSKPFGFTSNSANNAFFPMS